MKCRMNELEWILKQQIPKIVFASLPRMGLFDGLLGFAITRLGNLLGDKAA